MIETNTINVYNIVNAVRGMRNPMNSWDKSDSYVCENDAFENCSECNIGKEVIGPNDLKLCKNLIRAGAEHRKFLRQIFISLDILAPLYWFKEFDTYKIGTVANSCSTMHKIHSKEFTLQDFSTEHLSDESKEVLEIVIKQLNKAREQYLETKSKDDWWQMIQLLPTSYNQLRTITMNYENALNILHQRSHHKLDEWKVLCNELRDLPYIKEFEEAMKG